MSVSSPAEIPAAEYKLFVREDSARFYLRNNDEGVYLSPKGIGWFIGGQSHTRDWNEIEEVNLMMAHIPKQGPIGSCRIAFRDGKKLTVLSASKWGSSDAERNTEYGRFITDFHRVIPQGARGSIKFKTGVSKASHAAMAIIFVIAFLFFVVMPLGIAIYFRELQALLITGAGFAFVYPVYRMTEAAEPAEYDPARVPPDHYP
jgi:hypothetical protein